MNDKRLRATLLFGNFVLLVVLTMLVTQASLTSRKAADARARETTENLARSLASKAAAELALIDNGLATISMRYRRADPQREDLTSVMTRTLEDQMALLPHLLTIRIADERGDVVIGYASGMPALNIADRDYFERARTSKELIVSEPLRGKTNGKWGVVVARRLEHADGSFAGVVYGGLLSEHFSDEFSRIDIGAGGAIGLRSSSLRLVARFSPHEDVNAGLGDVNVVQEFRSAYALNPAHGVLEANARLDNVRRVFSWSQVDRYPLVLTVGIASDEVFKPWRLATAQMALLALLAFIISACLSSFVARQHAREVTARIALSQIAEEQRSVLENDLIGIFRVRDRRLTWANRAMGALFRIDTSRLVGLETLPFYEDRHDHDAIGLAYSTLRSGGRVRSQIRMRRVDGTVFWADLLGMPHSDQESLWMIVDITAVKDSEVNARYLALHDALTGLPNRVLMQERLAQILSDSARSGATAAVAYIDLDGFKTVNDSLGHKAGDEVLQAVAQRLTKNLRANDVAARLGGDEFAIVLSQVESEQRALEVLQRILVALKAPIAIGDSSVAQVGASIGLVVAVGGGDAEALQRDSDALMYEAKHAGKNRIVTAVKRHGDTSVTEA